MFQILSEEEFQDISAETEFVKPIATKRSANKNANAEREQQAFNLMKAAANKLNMPKDESTIFGEMVAAKLRKMSPRNQAIAQNRMNNMLFEIEMEEIAVSSTPLSSPPPQFVATTSQLRSPPPQFVATTSQLHSPPSPSESLHSNQTVYRNEDYSNSSAPIVYTVLNPNNNHQLKEKMADFLHFTDTV